MMRFLCILVLFTSHAAFASDKTSDKRVYVTHRVNPHAPLLDGRLDDVSWQKTEWQTGFVQREPDDGAPPSEQTAFKILYDNDNLYFAIRAFDSEPDEIVRRVTRRDGFDGDWVEINIDSYFDHRTGFSFTVNAAGVKGDEAISQDGDNWDSDWDPVWFSEVASDSLGWTAEIRIPLSQLRFGDNEEHVWGLQLQRRLFRKEERSVWQYISRNSPGWVSFFGELRGIRDIKAPRRVELLPYVVTDSRTLPNEPGNPFVAGRQNDLSGGLDSKIGITSDLTLDVTVNPDFGQVEADPSEVNLTAFETFFQEKRPFFIEGQNILDYPIMGGDGGFSNDRLFYSRRIGRAPQRSPDLDDDEHSVQPENTSILTAMKLTGKTRSGWSVGLLDAVTRKEIAQIDHFGARRSEVVEPLGNYFVGRLQKDFDQGNTAVGAILTAAHRDISADNLNDLNTAAYSGGVDFRHQWQDKTYSLDVRTAFSNIRGDRAAITEAQESSRRYYQRPDADYVTFDSTRTSLSGHGGMVTLSRSGKSRFRGAVGGMWRSPGLELNDVGFLRQADRAMQWSWLQYRITNPLSVFRNLSINFNQWWGLNFGGETVFAGGNINGGGQFKNHWRFWLGFGRDGKNLSTTELRGGPALKLPATWRHWYNLSTDGRKSYQFGLSGSNGWDDTGGSRRHRLGFWLRLRPKDSVQLRINPFYAFNKRDYQYVDTIQNVSAEDRYILGQLNQKTFGITFRFDVSVTPNLSIQYYGQPFISAGRYSSFKSVTQPRAASYPDRFYHFAANEFILNAEEEYTVVRDSQGAINKSIEQPNFNFREFRSNLIVRWEYNPGSTLFLVWTQERTGDDADGRFSVSGGLRDLFSETSTNVFLLKVSRWFSL